MTHELTEVQLVGVPPDLHEEANQHLQGLNREFELIRRGDQGVSSLSHRLRALIDELDGQFGQFGAEPMAELAAATARGDKTVDLVYRIPAAAGDAARRLGELLDDADTYCRAGEHLLTLVAPPEVLRYRGWFLGEFERQTGGLPPTPWAEASDASRAAETSEDRSRPGDDGPAPSRVLAPVPEGWSVSREDGRAHLGVAGPLDLVSAPALREVLIELVSTSPTVVVDLGECDFLDSVGLSVLLAADVRARDQGTSVSFRLSAATQRVLAVSGVLERLELET